MRVLAVFVLVAVAVVGTVVAVLSLFSRLLSLLSRFSHFVLQRDIYIYMRIAASSHGPWYSTLVALSLASSELERANDGAPGVCFPFCTIVYYCSFGIWTTAFACRSLFSTFGEK